MRGLGREQSATAAAIMLIRITIRIVISIMIMEMRGSCSSRWTRSMNIDSIMVEMIEMKTERQGEDG